jgi:hypothetical protein
LFVVFIYNKVGNVRNIDARLDSVCLGHFADGDTMLIVVAIVFWSVAIFLWANNFFIC